MPAKPITAKQSHWLHHVKAADASDGTLSDYASEHSLNLKALYQWKTKLIKLGLYAPTSNFVPIRKLPSEPHSACKVTLSNGACIEFTGALDSGAIRSIIRSAGLER